MSVTSLNTSPTFQAGRAITKRLHPAEDSIDQSILDNCHLMTSIISGRMLTKVAPEIGHDAFLSSLAMLTSLSEARSHGIECHRQLATVRDDLGMDANMLGCTVTKGRARDAVAKVREASVA